METISVTLPDGSTQKVEKGTTGLSIAESISEGLARAATCVRVNDKLYDLTRPITEDASVEILTFDSPEGKDVFRHTTSHLFAQALLRKYPQAKIAIGPAVEQGFYYDFEYDGFTEEDMHVVEAEMKAIIKEKLPIERRNVTKEEARKLFSENPYKLEMIDEFPEESLTVYQQGDFVDLCRGPHLPHTGKMKAVMLTKLAGAYWRGDSANKQLVRVYGISFPDKKLLKEYKHMIEEAEKRDHKKLGKELDLFSFHEEGPGFPFWHHKGMVLRNELIEYWRSEHRDEGYVEVQTPTILNRTLWEQSGHWKLYKENMYTTTIDKEDYAIKPMNCPGGMLIYKTRMHSYRELPLRVGELGQVHRHELSGVLNGLFRVRCFTQDDAHIFCTQEQLAPEIKRVVNLVQRMLKPFQFTEYLFTLSVRSEKKKEKYLGTDVGWNTAEDAIKEALGELGIAFSVEEGEAKFYGPSLDVQIKDALGRKWQCSTIQLDFNLADRFDITYEGQDGQKHKPFILHRVVYGSLERFIGIITEHYAGKFPLWISPVQVKLLPITDRNKEFAEEVRARLHAEGIRVELDARAATVGKKIRDAEIEHFNYILVLGDKECEKGVVNVRTRDNEILGEQDVEAFLEKLKAEITSKGME